MYRKKKTRATLGFVLSKDLKNIVFIEKQKPIQHRGLVNGLGGKNETGENDRDCISREVFEESGIVIAPEKWHSMGRMTWDIWDVAMFTGVLETTSVPSFLDPAVSWYNVYKLPKNIVSNLYWLVPLAISVHTRPQSKGLLASFFIKYHI